MVNDLEARLLAKIIDRGHVHRHVEAQRRVVADEARHVEQPFRRDAGADVTAVQTGAGDVVRELCLQAIQDWMARGGRGLNYRFGHRLRTFR